MDTYAVHKVELIETIAGGSMPPWRPIRALCLSCTWSGPQRHLTITAEQDRDGHIARVQRAARRKQGAMS